MRIHVPQRINREHTIYGMPLRMASWLIAAGGVALLGLLALLNGVWLGMIMWLVLAMACAAMGMGRVDNLPLEQWLLRRVKARRRPRHLAYRLPIQQRARRNLDATASVPAAASASVNVVVTVPQDRRLVQLAALFGVSAAVCVIVAVLGIADLGPMGHATSSFLDMMRQEFFA